MEKQFIFKWVESECRTLNTKIDFSLTCSVPSVISLNKHDIFLLTKHLAKNKLGDWQECCMYPQWIQDRVGHFHKK